MKRRWAALLCAAFLLLLLPAAPASAAGTFFLALNDTLATQILQTTPVEYNGWIYVPATVFDSRVTGINFGVYYGLSEDEQVLTFYALTGQTLTFTENTAVTSDGTQIIPEQVLWQNGVYYVPAYAICQYFGLSYSFYNTDYGPMLRIKDGNAVLSDSMMVGSVSSLMRGLSNAGNQNNSAAAPTPSESPSPPAATPAPVVPSNPARGSTTSGSQREEPAEEPEEREEAAAPEVPVFALYLGLRAPAESNITTALDGLEANQATAVVFFPADEISARSDQVRQAIGRGHRIGLIPRGETGEEKLQSVTEANWVMMRLTRQECWFVLGEDAVLRDAGYLCWVPNLADPSASTPEDLYWALRNGCAGRRETNRVLLDGSAHRWMLGDALKLLRQDGDTFLQPRETAY